ncbi:IclR family transcriptional regulator [Pseudooceanicola nitratireducens]|uniref:IclR family transcriptional regulator n=1 Tax=Pseudooceanicola nitratireducens TaxID=517719 RepID=UPI003C7B41D9
MSNAVQSVDRALRLLELVAADPDGRRLSDLARAAGLAVSTTHRLLTSLEQRGFVQVEGETGLWHVGQTAHRVGAAWGRARTMLAPAMPHLRRLRDATRETANLGLIEDGWVVTLAQAESREIMRAISPPGGRAPTFCSGMGKAIVATWPDAQIDQLIDRHGLSAATRNSLTRREDVHAEIARIRDQGFAMDDEEFVPGLRCVAAVIEGPGGDAVAAVSVSGLSLRMTPEKVARCAELVQRVAVDLSGRVAV